MGLSCTVLHTVIICSLHRCSIPICTVLLTSSRYMLPGGELYMLHHLCVKLTCVFYPVSLLKVKSTFKRDFWCLKAYTHGPMLCFWNRSNILPLTHRFSIAVLENVRSGLYPFFHILLWIEYKSLGSCNSVRFSCPAHSSTM